MTQKTEQFKTSQSAKWADGKIANGANFSQLIAEIARLVDETKSETLREAESLNGDTYTDEKAKAAAVVVLNDSEKFTKSGLYTTIEALINQKADYATIEQKLLAKLQSEASQTVTRYTSTGSTVTLASDAKTIKQIEISNGGQYLQDAENLAASKISNAGVYELVRPDGARLILNETSRTIKPAAVLIG